MRRSRGEQAIIWIEKHCATPFGNDRGQHIRLTDDERSTLRRLYDYHQQDKPIVGNLAAYIALMHLCGIEYRESLPMIDAMECLAFRRGYPASMAQARRRSGYLPDARHSLPGGGMTL